MRVALLRAAKPSSPLWLPDLKSPLTVSLLGQNLLEYWLSHLSQAGITRVWLLMDKSPAGSQTIVQEGLRWGLDAKVVEEPEDLSPLEIRLKYASRLHCEPGSIVIEDLDHFPGMPDRLLWSGPAEFMNSLLAWMPHARTPDRIGFRETRPQVWVGLHACISPEAQLRAPCWVGQDVIIGPGARVGPYSILEDGVILEADTEVTESWVGSRTLVGQFLCLANSLAWGSSLVNWHTDTAMTVADSFILCSLGASEQSPRTSWRRRLGDWYQRNRAGSPLLWNRLMTNKGS
jgi:hypothetical protein